MEIVLVAGLWLVLCFVVAAAAKAKNRSAFGWFFLALVISPLFAVIFLIAFPTNTEPLSNDNPVDRFIHASNRRSPREKNVETAGKVSLLVVCLSLAAGIFYYAKQTSLPASKLADWSADAISLEEAKQIDALWVASFDKTGRLPEKAAIDKHQKVLGSLARMTAESPSFAVAQPFKEKMLTRTSKINAALTRALAPSNAQKK